MATEAILALVDVSAAVATGNAHVLEAALGHAQDVAGTIEIEEALLQSYLFVGYPGSLRALAVWRRVSGQPAATSQRLDPGEWRARGEATCARIYGGQYERLRGNVSALHPDIERWMIEEGYGKVLSRPGLDLATRELCIVALLAPQDAAPQLYSHLRGALNAGCAPDLVDAVVRRLAQRVVPARAAILSEQWNAVRGRRPEAGG